MALQAIDQTEFLGGLNYVSSPYRLRPDQVAEAVNLVLDEHGSLRVRDGIQSFLTGPSGIQTRPLALIAAYVSGSVKKRFVVTNRTANGENQLYDASTTPWTLVTGLGGDQTLGGGEDIPQAVQMLDRAIVANGYVTPVVWDGGATWRRITALTGQTVPPGAKHLAFHLGSLWLFNTAPTTSSLDGPSSLRMSAANDFDSWPNANQVFVAKDDGQVGMGMSSFTVVETGISPTATLVLFKDYSTYQATGTIGSSNFSLQLIKSDMGCIAPRTIQFVSGFGVMRLTHKGVALFNGVEDRLISEEIRPALFGGRGWNPIDFAHVAKAWATQAQNPPLYILALPEAGSSLTRIFLYDLVRRAWTRMVLPQPWACLAVLGLGGQDVEVLAGTVTGANIVKLFTGEAHDGSGPIAWEVRTRRFVGHPTRRVYWRRAHLLVAGPAYSSVTVKAIVDGQERPAATRTIQPRSGHVYPRNEIEHLIVYDLAETAYSVQLVVSGSGPQRLRAVELHAVPKPLMAGVDFSGG